MTIIKVIIPYISKYDTVDTVEISMVSAPSALFLPPIDKMIELVTHRSEAELEKPFGHLEYHRWLAARLSLVSVKSFNYTPMALQGFTTAKFSFIDPRDGISTLDIQVKAIMGKRL
jgi:hypothetical protein